MDAESRRGVARGVPCFAWHFPSTHGSSRASRRGPTSTPPTAPPPPRCSKVPYLDDVVRRLIALGYERALRAAALGSSVRLGQEQLPHIWVLHRQSFNALDLEAVPDLYMTQFPLANAATIGTDRPVVVVNSELVRILDDDGRRAVLAHEAAHVHSGHVLYQTAMLILLRHRHRRAPAAARRAAAAGASSSRCWSGSAAPS